MPAWVDAGFREYAKRLPRHCALRLIEIPARRRGERADATRLLREEGNALLGAVPKDCRLVALDRAGQQRSTEELAEWLRGRLAAGQDLALLVGGADGLSPECRRAAAERWSLSRLTFPHPLVRVLVAEQLYRAWSIIANLPYHRAG